MSPVPFMHRFGYSLFIERFTFCPYNSLRFICSRPFTALEVLKIDNVISNNIVDNVGYDDVIILQCHLTNDISKNGHVSNVTVFVRDV